MECHKSIEMLYESDPAELRGDEVSELGSHLSECPKCKRAAERILAMDAGLGGWLGELEARQNARDEGSAVTGRSSHETEGRLGSACPSPVGEGVHRTAGRPAPRRIFWTAFLPAAAAVLAGLLLVDGREGGTDLPTFPLTSQARAAELPPLVEAAPGKNVVVLETQNPKITLVWLY
jgi:anti-sigma factor RsiW